MESGVWKMRSVENAECGKTFKKYVIDSLENDLTQCNLIFDNQ